MAELTFDEIVKNMRGRPSAATLMGPGAAPAAAPPLPTPAAPGMQIPSWLKSAGNFLKRPVGKLLGGATAVAGGVGALSAAADDMYSATPDNRPERARRILKSGASAASFGATGMLDDWYNNRPAAPDYPDIAGPATRDYMARGPGATPAPPQTGTIPSTVAPVDESVGPGGWANDPARRAAQLEVEQLQIQMDANRQRHGVGARYQPTSVAGGFMQAQLGLKEISGTNAARVAAAKAASDAALKAAQGGEARAKTSEIGARMGLGAQAKARGASEAEVAGIVSGRPVSDIYKESVTSMPDPKTGAVTLISGRSGDVRKVVPTPARPSVAEIKSTAAKNKMTEAQVIERLKREGRW